MGDVAMSPLFFEEDVVLNATRRAMKVGIVVGSYADTFSEDEWSDDEGVPLQLGDVRVAFYPLGEDKLMKECTVIKLINMMLLRTDWRFY